ncbi:VWA domain-containing protein, partial [Frankia sp. CiP1_Cm_nod2]|uniref:VWA domain-containing protein n=1 Tax=Frankia sp. CiP1_Cm_nod2 TaxID=2897161 RepID=UPI0020256F7C
VTDSAEIVSDGPAGTGAGPGTAEVIIIDSSGSMEGKKITEARRAAAVAIDTLPDGVAFAVVSGNSSARVVYPTSQTGLAEASAATRSAAKQAVHDVRAGGGTAIGQWLTLTRSLMETRPGAARHAILLTDGQNWESEDVFAAALARCEGVFQCDCRGVGADWRVSELRQIASLLLGSVELLRTPEQMADDFRAVVAAATARAVPDVTLRVWTPKGAAVRFLRQVYPEVDDLTGRGGDVNERTRDYPTGAWGAGTREYHLCVDVVPGPVGTRKLAARVTLVAGDTKLSEALVLAVWTDDTDLSTRINDKVAHYTGQEELARAIQEGIEARALGDDATAATRLGRATQLAAEADDEGTLRRLAKVVDIDDPATGKVRLRRDVDALDEMDLDVSSTKTVPAKR